MTPLNTVLKTAYDWQRIFAETNTPVTMIVKYSKGKSTSYVKVEIYSHGTYDTLIFFPDSDIDKANQFFEKVTAKL